MPSSEENFFSYSCASGLLLEIGWGSSMSIMWDFWINNVFNSISVQ